MVALSSPCLLHLCHRGSPGSVRICPKYEQRRGAVLPSPNDGLGASLGLLHRRGILTAYRPTAPRDYRHPAAHGEQDAGLFHNLLLLQGHSYGTVRPIPASAGHLPAGGIGDTGTRDLGCDQGEGQPNEVQAMSFGRMKKHEARLAAEFEVGAAGPGGG